MPLFRRSDGEVVPDVNPLRRLMPVVMSGRNQSIVYHRTQWDGAAARAWLRAYNRARPGQQQATVFHLLAYASMQTFFARPGLNRFVSGGRIYQRNGLWLSFALKTKLTSEAPLITVKLRFSEGDCFDEYVDRVTAAVTGGRSGQESAIEREARLLTKLPHSMLRFTVAAARRLDHLNLLPTSLISPDPLFTSVFLANLGSIHLDNVYHHLYEYGTCSLFGVVGGIKKALTISRKGDLEVKDMLQINWSFDERINDAFYCMEALEFGRRFIEYPDQYVKSRFLQGATRASAQSVTEEVLTSVEHICEI